MAIHNHRHGPKYTWLIKMAIHIRERVKMEEARLAKETLLLGLAEADALARERAQKALQKMVGSKKRREQLLSDTRHRARHEFRRLHPPRLSHANQADATTFVCDEHYIKHIAEQEDVPDLMAEFHLLLRRNDGWPLLQRFLDLHDYWVCTFTSTAYIHGKLTVFTHGKN